MKELLPAPHYAILRSFIAVRTFDVAVRDSRSSMQQIYAGVPQGIVIGPFLYNIYTADMSTPDEASPAQLLLVTYADDTAMLASHPSLQSATNAVQE